jgi:hypothetical protein
MSLTCADLIVAAVSAAFPIFLADVGKQRATEKRRLDSDR